MSKRIGKDCKVAIGSTKINGFGQWGLSGITAEQIDVTEFDDNWRQFEFGVKDGGTISFSGFMDPDDTNVLSLIEDNCENSDRTDIRLYIDDTSYFMPCQTTGYLHPTKTTGADTFLSHVNVLSFNVSADKSGMLTVDFNAKVTGVMVLV